MNRTAEVFEKIRDELRQYFEALRLSGDIEGFRMAGRGENAVFEVAVTPRSIPEIEVSIRSKS